MSSKAGYLKSGKKMANGIGKMLETLGNASSEFWGAKPVQDILGAIGRGVGMATVPIIGGKIGKTLATTAANIASYKSGLLGEIGQSMQDLANGSSFGQEVKDVLSYVPNRIIDNVKNSQTYQVLTGQTTIPDAIMNTLENAAYINYLAPNKTHAWKDNQGNYHREYVPGSKMVVGEWTTQQNNAPRPDINSNSGILGVYQGEVYRKGFDDARWAALQQAGKVK